MSLHEVSWIRAKGHKLCPFLKKAALKWYRPLKYMPCFLQWPFKFIKQRLVKLPVIVQLQGNQMGTMSIKEIAPSLGCRLHRDLRLVNAFSTKVNAKKLESLVNSSSVKKVWHDREVEAVLDVASPTVEAPPLWESKLTGKGINVAVLDTGVYKHPDLEGRIKAFKDLINRKTDPYDDNGHGTHVAGDVAANGSKSNSRYRGPAPEAEIVGVKVLDQVGSGSLSTVIEGLQWCVENKDALNIGVINMSLGSPAVESYRNDPVCQAVEKAWGNGIVVCAAAGNEGPQSSTISSPGIDPVIITVGALDDADTVETDDDKVAGFSSRGPTVDGLTKPDILAPGVNIISLRSPGSNLDKNNKNSRVGEWYTSLSGTSMATPVCAGVVAQMLQADGSLTPDQIKTRLMETARKLENMGPNIHGAGVVDAQKAASQPVN